MQNPEAVRDLWYPFDDDIVVAKHMRYHPLFKHVHGFYEMIYVLSGTGYNYMDGTSFAMTDGSVCIIPPDVSHAIGIFDDSVIANILIKKSAFDRTFSKFLSEENILSSFLSKSLRGGRAYRYLFFPAGSEKLNRILEALLLEGVVKDEYSSPLKKTLLLEAFYCLLREQRDIAGLSEYDEPNAEILYAIRNYTRPRILTIPFRISAD